eukprot:1154322-Pelagomonas_calceolata.AAC.7
MTNEQQSMLVHFQHFQFQGTATGGADAHMLDVGQLGRWGEVAAEERNCYCSGLRDTVQAHKAICSKPVQVDGSELLIKGNSSTQR